jgi:hypothetical protein
MVTTTDINYREFGTGSRIFLQCNDFFGRDERG